MLFLQENKAEDDEVDIYQDRVAGFPRVRPLIIYTCISHVSYTLSVHDTCV